MTEREDVILDVLDIIIEKLEDARDDILTANGICPKCRQSFIVHNDDGSCVED